MEPPIRRVRFFNGQFLRQEEFREEQAYGIHMRRRINYVLFEDGVVQVTSSDLTIAPESPGNPADKRIRVLRGMAIGANHDVFESREIILREDSPIFDLSDTFAAGATVWVTVNFSENETEPVPLGSGSENSRVEETAEIRLHPTEPTGPDKFTADGDPLIVLGSVDFDTMTVSTADRQVARLRAVLVGSSGGGGATLVSIAISPAGPLTLTEGDTVTLTAEGTFSDSSVRALTAADGLAWSSSDPAATIDASGLLTAVSAGNATITAAVGAVTGSVGVTVSPPAANPNIINLAPSAQASGGLVDVIGDDIHDSGLGANVSAVGTVIRLRRKSDPTDTKDGLNIITRSPIGGHQVVRFTVPPRGTWGANEVVTLELEFGGGVATSDFEYDD
ncbi:MAG TPA: Ig-like domain-containing protein [Longimicrobiales bacterium]